MFRWTESGAERTVEIEDESPEVVFREGVVAVGDILTEERGGDPLAHTLRLASDGLGSLFEAWVREMVRLDEQERFVCERVVKLVLTGAALEAQVAGQRFDHGKVVESVRSAGLVHDESDGVWRAAASFTLAKSG